MQQPPLGDDRSPYECFHTWPKQRSNDGVSMLCGSFAILTTMNIHFICRGNVLRSLIAETYVKSLDIENVRVISSGTNSNWNDPKEREYFANTLAVLKRHGIDSFAKDSAEQVTQERIDSHHDVVVLMNQRVAEEAAKLVELPPIVLNWEIVDIGEGSRMLAENRELYEEEIYHEILRQVDDLVKINRLI